MSFIFGPRSLGRLATCDERLQRLMHHAIDTAPLDFTIVCGWRNKADQDKAVAEGNSKTPWPTSKHNRMIGAEPMSLAVDIAPMRADGEIEWNDQEPYKVLARHIFECAKDLGIKIRWGGDFDRDGVFGNDRFIDLPHFELDEP